MNLVSLTKNESFVKDSDELEIKPNQKYEMAIETICKKGWPYSAYFTVIILDQYGKEIIRFIRWLNDFSSIIKKNSLVFSTPTHSKTAIIGFRINVETPVKSDFEIELPEASSLKIKQIENEPDSFDDLETYQVPKLPELTTEQENTLEKKTIWLFGAPRSGTTWLGTQLLIHSENLIWAEPWIGFHLGTLDFDGSKDINKKYERVYDTQSSGGRYFFSPHHKKNWLPALRRFIISRIFSQVQTLGKNVIIKEPVGSHSADIIMECMPKSKLVFLLRDGRDILESRMDMHRGSKSWSGLREFKNDKEKRGAIKYYSIIWNGIMERINRAYENHDPKLRIIIRYEDLKKDTLSELKKIYDFLDIKISDDELRRKIELFDFKNIPESQKGEGKFYRSASTGGWTKKFSKEEQELMNSIMGDTLKQMGYDA